MRAGGIEVRHDLTGRGPTVDTWPDQNRSVSSLRMSQTDRESTVYSVTSVDCATPASASHTSASASQAPLSNEQVSR